VKRSPKKYHAKKRYEMSCKNCSGAACSLKVNVKLPQLLYRKSAYTKLTTLKFFAPGAL